jgi:hypothetical protein
MNRGMASKTNESNVVAMICGRMRSDVPLPTKKISEDAPKQKAIGKRKIINNRKLPMNMIASIMILRPEIVPTTR